jgi:hypothetical protein
MCTIIAVTGSSLRENRLLGARGRLLEVVQQVAVLGNGG